jgi:hypothetical protein
MGRRILNALNIGAFCAAVLAGVSLSIAASAQCPRDVDGSCSRPIRCQPPAGGFCVTTPRLPGGTQFGCECKAKPPPSPPPSSGNSSAPPHSVVGTSVLGPSVLNTGTPTAGSTARDSACRERCEHELINCAADAKTTEERNRCFSLHQRCIEDCTLPTAH